MDIGLSPELMRNWPQTANESPRVIRSERAKPELREVVLKRLTKTEGDRDA